MKVTGSFPRGSQRIPRITQVRAVDPFALENTVIQQHAELPATAPDAPVTPEVELASTTPGDASPVSAHRATVAKTYGGEPSPALPTLVVVV